MKSLIGTDMADYFFALRVPLRIELSVYIIDYLYFAVYLAYIYIDVLVGIMLCFTRCLISLADAEWKI